MTKATRPKLPRQTFEVTISRRRWSGARDGDIVEARDAAGVVYSWTTTREGAPVGTRVKVTGSVVRTGRQKMRGQDWEDFARLSRVTESPA